MPPLKFTSQSFTSELESGFSAIRKELEIPVGFPEPVQAEAEAVANRGPVVPPGGVKTVVDRTDLPLITIDPPGSIDLDQAYAAEATATGYRVWYAIADVAAFVGPGSALDTEALGRGVTLYSPDMRASLHPEAINERAASLLAGTDKQVVLWQIDLDQAGNQTAAHAQRATVRSREQLNYAEAQQRIDDGSADTSLALLKTIGTLRQNIEAERGAISLQLASQEITQNSEGNYALHFDESMPVEGWNAQISLLTGIAGAQIMVDAGHGLLRTLPPLDDRIVAEVRRCAKALSVDWPESVDYPSRMRSLNPNTPAESALLARAARSFRGAGYEAFADGQVPKQPLHGAIASIYSHVTAPLRRVCDRYTNEIILSHCAGIEAPEWAVAGLDQLPAIMGASRQRDRSLERATVDFVEAMVLRNRVGDAFDGIVLSHTRKGSNVQIADPAVLVGVDGKAELGSVISVKLDAVNTKNRSLDFRIAK